jgi:DNA-binding GntR family transcriptional regulator
MSQMSKESQFHPDGALESRTIQQRVTERLAEAIAKGYLTPGHRLVYSEIADEMHVSITPVREAMKGLEARGLVTIRPRRAAFVSYLTADEVGQLYQVRTLVEGLATQLGVERITRRQLAHMRKVYEGLDRVIAALNSASIDEADRSELIVSLQSLHDEFHNGLYASCGNKYLLQVIALV